MNPFSTLLFENHIGRIGHFRCPVDHPNFQDTGPIRSGHLIVFPRTPVCITLAHHDPVVADANSVMFYNYAQEYRRAAIVAEGDSCEWFAYAPELLAQAIADCSNGSQPTTAPFQWVSAPCDPHAYLLQRLIVTQVTAAPLPPDELWLEEAMLTLLARIIRHACVYRPSGLICRKRQTRHEQAAIVRAVQQQLAIHYTEAVTLETLAQTVYLSPYELCRTFRAHTGQSIHHYLTQLRLRRALELLADDGDDLTTVALGLGYSSHSHFTSAFRRSFGITPSMLRSRPNLFRTLPALSDHRH